MQLHALLPDESYRRLLAAVTPRHKVRRLISASDLSIAAGAGEVAACIVDPLARRPEALDALRGAISAGDFPVLIYTSLDSRGIGDILQLQRCGDADLLFREHDEQPQYLRAAIERMGTPSAASLVLRELAPNFGWLPSLLGSQFVGAFGGLPIPRTVPELFRRGGVKQRTGNRCMTRAHLRDAEHVLGCARLVRTWAEVCDPRSNLALVAERAGIGTERALSNAYHAYCGFSSREAARELTTREFAARAASATQL